MPQKLSQIEKEFYSLAASKSGYLHDLKTKVYVQEVGEKNIIQGERIFLHKFITDYGQTPVSNRYLADLFKQAVSLTGQTPTQHINENKRLFYQSPVAKLYYYTKSLNPVAYYPMNETSGTTAFNRDSGSEGTLDGTITGATVGQAGQIGKAYDFDGVNNVVTTTANAAFNTVDFSVFMLIYPGTLRIQGIFDKSDSTNSWRIFMNDTNGKIEFDAVADTDNLNSTTDLSVTTWSSLGVTYNKATTTATIYVNGVAAGTTATFTDAVNESNTNPQIAPSHTARFDGLVQHLAFFNTSISAGQMLKLAQIAGLA